MGSAGGDDDDGDGDNDDEEVRATINYPATTGHNFDNSFFVTNAIAFETR